MSDLPEIDPRAFVHEGARLSVGCVVKSGAYVCNGVSLESGVYIGPNVVFVEPSANFPIVESRVEKNVRIGANSTIWAGVSIGSTAVVRPGSVVTKAVPPNAIVEGNPASIVGYIDAVNDSVSGSGDIEIPTAPSERKTTVKGVTLHTFPLIPDMRGSLTVCEFEKQIPFSPKRSFMVFDVPSREVRGEHAHHHCHQFLICVRGSCAVLADDGENKIEVVLDAPNRGIYLPPMIWGVQYKYSPDALLIVFASDYYDASDYIRSYAEFLNVRNGRPID